MKTASLRFSIFSASLILAATISPTSAQDKYAVVIGVETYDEDFTALDYAEEDAVEIGKSLEKLGFKTTVMTSQARKSSLKPTNAKKILKVVQTQIDSCGNGDTLVISLSGHGIQFSDEALLKSGVRETYFCPEDADVADKNSLVGINGQIIKLMNDSAATRKLLLIDACRNEVLSETAKRKGTKKKLELESVHETRRSVPGGMAVLFSCKSKQFSWEHDKLGHSVFSNFVIQYLAGKAETKYYDSGNVELDNLVSYVRKQTNDYVFHNSLSADGQLPILRGSGANWPLGKIKNNIFTNSIGMKFTRIPAGRFLMGSPKDEKGRYDDEFQHEVEITNDFFMGTFEVTRGQFSAFVKDTGYKTDAEKDGEGGYGWNEKTEKFEGRDPKYNWKNAGFKQTDSHPVINVSWNDAKAFCKWLSNEEGREYRLPTEAEWEYSCRGGSTTVYSFGDAPEGLSKVGNTADRSAKEAWGKNYSNLNYLESDDDHVFTAPIGEFAANYFGLYDMHGNVFEWCEDWYDGDYYKTSPKQDPLNSTAGSSRVLRGGGWGGSASDCRSARRYSYSPSLRHSSFGFRLVLVR